MGSCLTTCTPRPSSTPPPPSPPPPPPPPQHHQHEEEEEAEEEQKAVVKEVLSSETPTTKPTSFHDHTPPKLIDPLPLDDPPSSEISLSSSTLDDPKPLRPPILRPPRKHRSLSADLPHKPRQQWRPAGRSPARRPQPPPRPRPQTRSVSPAVKRPQEPPLRHPSSPPASAEEETLENPLVALECFIFL